MDEKILQQIFQRLERVEQAVFAKRQKPEHVKQKAVVHKGATGGVRLLVEDGFFNKKKQFGEICDAATARGYLYSKQAFQEALNRLSKKGGPLVALLEQGRKIYAIRK